MGDKQVVYGVLWHIWQYEETQARKMDNENPAAASASTNVQDSTLLLPPPPPPLELLESAVKRLSGFTAKPHRLDAARAAATSRAFDLDVPALALVDAQERKKSKQILSKPTRKKDPYVSWDQDSALGDDIYSLPNPSTVRRAEPLIVMSASTILPQAPVEPIERKAVVSEDKVATISTEKPLDPADLSNGNEDQVEVVPAHSAAAEMTSKLSPGNELSAFRHENRSQEVYTKHNSTAEGTDELLKWLKQLNIRLPTPSAFQVRLLCGRRALMAGF